MPIQVRAGFATPKADSTLATPKSEKTATVDRGKEPLDTLFAETVQSGCQFSANVQVETRRFWS